MRSRRAVVMIEPPCVAEKSPKAQPPPLPGADDATDGDNDMEPDHALVPGAPRWVSVLLIVLGVIVFLLIVVSHLAGVVGPGAH